jgi:hypothetical protein
MTKIPRCSSCHVETAANIASQVLDQHYQIYYCTSCGSVYGVVPVPTLLATAQTVSSEVVQVATPKEAAPTCPQHNLPLKKKTVPAGNKDAGKTFWVCPKVKECHQYREITTEQAESETGKMDTEHLILAEVGEADLSTKDPLNPERMQAKLQAMRMFRPGTRYMRVAYDAGPPVCSDHNLEMVELTIPKGYKNAGRRIWRCPKYQECHRWELAE